MIVYALISDLFFSARVGETAKHAGIDVRFFGEPQALHDALRSEPADLVLVDLSQQSLRPIEVVRQLKRSPVTAEIPVLGYLSHVDFPLQQEARAAGIDKVVARSEFTSRLSEILRGEF